MSRTFLASLAALSFASAANGASVDGLEIHSVEWGSADDPTIVFVHGWTCDTSSWREQVPAFSGNYHVIALDLPGHGQSDSPPPDGFSMELFARAVEAVRAEAGANEIVLVGHSMGGPVIRQYALMYPEHVAGLIAVDGPIDLRGFGNFTLPAPTLENREAMIRGMFVPETAPELQEHILEMMLSAPEATARGAQAAMFDPALRTNDVIEAPILAVVAGTGQVPDMATVHQVAPRFEAKKLAGTGHFLMMEKPAEFNELMQTFLDQIEF